MFPSKLINQTLVLFARLLFSDEQYHLPTFSPLVLTCSLARLFVEIRGNFACARLEKRNERSWPGKSVENLAEIYEVSVEKRGRVRGSLWARIFETVPRKFAYLEPSDERDSGVTRPNKTISRLVSSHSPIWIFPPCLYPLHTSNDASAIPFILRLNLRRFCFAILFRDLPCDTL